MRDDAEIFFDSQNFEAEVARMNEVRKFFCNSVNSIQDAVNQHPLIVRAQSDLPNFDDDVFFIESYVSITYRIASMVPFKLEEQDFAKKRMRRQRIERMVIYSDATGAMVGEPDQVISCLTEACSVPAPKKGQRVIITSSSDSDNDSGSESNTDSDVEDVDMSQAVASVDKSAVSVNALVASVDKSAVSVNALVASGSSAVSASDLVASGSNAVSVNDLVASDSSVGSVNKLVASDSSAVKVNDLVASDSSAVSVNDLVASDSSVGSVNKLVASDSSAVKVNKLVSSGSSAVSGNKVVTGDFKAASKTTNKFGVEIRKKAPERRHTIMLPSVQNAANSATLGPSSLLPSLFPINEYHNAGSSFNNSFDPNAFFPVHNNDVVMMVEDEDNDQDEFDLLMSDNVSIIGSISKEQASQHGQMAEDCFSIDLSQVSASRSGKRRHDPLDDETASVVESDREFDDASVQNDDGMGGIVSGMEVIFILVYHNKLLITHFYLGGSI
jgi:hypothetical protein